MAYIGNEPVIGQWRKLDDISGSFNGSLTSFTTQVGGTNVTAGSANQLLVSLGGVLQEPGTDYSVSSSTITFTTAPAASLSFFAVLAGDALNTSVPADGSITTAKLGSNLTVDLDLGSAGTPSLTFDADSGLFSGGDNQVAVSTNGVERVEFGASEVVFNDGGANYDFRVEGDTDANLLFVDASTDRVGIGTNSPDTALTISEANVAVTSQSSNVNIYANDALAADIGGSLGLGATWNGTGGLINYASIHGKKANSTSGNTDGYMSFVVRNNSGTSERMRIDSSGRVGIGTNSPTLSAGIGLHLRDGNTGIRLNPSSDGGQGYIEYADESDTVKYISGYRDASNTYNICPGTSLAADAGLHITSDGKVGIGNADPADIDFGLNIAQSNDDGGALGWTDGSGSKRASIQCTGTGDALRFRTGTSDTERFRIDSNGKIVIGDQVNYGDNFQILDLGDSDLNSIIVFVQPGGGNSTAQAAVWVRKSNSSGRSINAAGTVNASGADYAEYMTKAGDFSLAKGDVCGVNADGKLTNVFAEAISFVVKSTDPSYVGGDTWGAEEVVGTKPDAEDADALAEWEAGFETARQKVDRIAFAGQVPVNVTGATAGQYIIPVQASDGSIEGSSKNESDLTLSEYMRAVGKVVAIENDGRARIIVKVA